MFDAVMVWAGYGSEVASADSACHPMADLDALLPCIRFPLMRDEQLAAVGCGAAACWLLCGCCCCCCCCCCSWGCAESLLQSDRSTACSSRRRWLLDR